MGGNKPCVHCCYVAKSDVTYVGMEVNTVRTDDSDFSSSSAKQNHIPVYSGV